jgi:ketosteroid isomerase-like protein
MYGRALGADGQWASTLIYGRNKHAGEKPSQSGLIESEAVLDRHNTVFGRAEYVQKSAHELQQSAFPDERLFGVGGVSLGYIRELTRGRGMTLGLGTRGTMNFVPKDLESSYGSRTPVGGMVFLRLRPYHSQPHVSMDMRGMQHHDATANVPSDSADVLEAVRRYHSALATGDSATALSLLAPDAVILESGGVEAREEYRSHHLPADIDFARAVPSERANSRVTVRGDVAWVSSTSTSRGEFRGRPINSRGAELMVLSREANGWKIRAIHWSSRNRNP